LNKHRFEGVWKRRIDVKRVLSFLLVFLVILSGLSVFLGLISAQAGQGEGKLILLFRLFWINMVILRLMMMAHFIQITKLNYSRIV
jgi:hypothetical protein